VVILKKSLWWKSKRQARTSNQIFQQLDFDTLLTIAKLIGMQSEDWWLEISKWDFAILDIKATKGCRPVGQSQLKVNWVKVKNR